MKKIIPLIFLVLLYAGSCVQSIDGTGYPLDKSRKWTFIVYMAADNNLESAAIADFNELEAVNLAGQPVSILVLFDRCPGFDATNGDWTDTRLYEIKTDPGGNNATIVSKRLDCPELGLTAASDTELSMSDPLVLSHLLEYAQRVYRADNYGLLVWGHGTGWRGSGGGGSVPEPVKAVAIDDTYGGYMSLKSFGGAISGKGLSVVGFDTCFGAILEAAYQIKDSAEYLVASEGVIPSTGWDYRSLFNVFLNNYASSGLPPSGFCDAVISQYSAQYGGTSNATISKINLTKVNDLFTAFEQFALVLANNITTVTLRDSVRNAILTGPAIDRYYDSSFPSNLYIDIESFGAAMPSLITAANATALQSALNAAVPSSWSQAYGTSRRSLGIYVIDLVSDGAAASTHEPGYIKGSPSMDKSAFVENSNSWTPHSSPVSTSFLDKLFYWVF
ncbi:hypothetical protein FACS189491_06800 [Spirochaetia bacterium]|nr:hypothetical protein FACS189491_06800 [Spirochaetia bacterium]